MYRVGKDFLTVESIKVSKFVKYAIIFQWASIIYESNIVLHHMIKKTYKVEEFCEFLIFLKVIVNNIFLYEF